MYTRKDAEAYITEAIENGDVNDAAAEYDIDGIVDSLYTNIGNWDITNVHPEIFWAAVERHAINSQTPYVAPGEPAPITGQTAQIADDLIRAGKDAREAREASAEKASERDALIIRAYRTGAFTQTRLAEMAGVNQQRVSQLLAR